MAISKVEMERRKIAETGDYSLATTGKNELILTDTTNARVLYERAMAVINSRRPSSCLTIWGANRQIQFQSLDRDSLIILCEQLNYLYSSLDLMAQVEARRILFPQMVQGLINHSRKQAELASKQFEDSLKQIDDQATTRYLQNSLLQAQVQAIQTDNGVKKIIAEAEAIAIVAKANIDKAKAEKEYQISRLVNSIVNQGIDINNASITATFIMNSILGAGGNIDVDSILKERMSDLMREKQQRENDIIDQKLRKERYDADIKESNAKNQTREDEELRGGTRSNI